MPKIKSKQTLAIKENKKLSATFIFVFFALISSLIYWQFTKAAVSSYNFSGITNPSGTHIARSFEVDIQFPTNGALTLDTLTDDGSPTGTPEIKDNIYRFGNDAEATNDEYTKISTSDDSHWQTPNPGFSDMTAFWAQYTIAESPANITQIDINLEGYQGGTPQGGRKAWLGVWVPGAPTPYWKTLEAAQKTTDYVYSGTLTTNLEDYIDSNDKLTIIFYNEDEFDSLLVDYVNVDVTSGLSVAPPAILSALIDDPDNGDRKLSVGDTITLTFDKDTNAPAVATKADIDNLILFPTSNDVDGLTYNHLIGADYIGTWSSNTFANDTLTITVTNGIINLANREVELKMGEIIQIKADGTNDLKDSGEASDASASFVAITGNWGLRPDDDVTYASDHNANAHIYEVALLNKYHYRHATAYQSRGDLTYVGHLPISTYAIGRRPIDGFIYAAENGTDDGKLSWMDPEKKDTTSTAPDGYDPATLGNPYGRGTIGTLGPTVEEYYRLVFTASGILYGAANNNKLYRVYDSIQVGAPASTHGAVDNLAGDPICTMMPDLGDVPNLQLTENGSADFAFDSDGKLLLISNDILYWVETGPLVGGIITGPCVAHAIKDTNLSEISGLAFTKGGVMHVSTFLPTNRKLTTVDPENGNISNTSDFTPDQDIYDLGSVPKWTDIEIVKSDGGLEFEPGTNEIYTLTVSNDADVLDPNLSDARGPIFVRDTLPEGFTFVSVSGVDWSCDHVGQLIECVNPNNLVKGASFPPITVTVFVENNAVSPNPPYEPPEGVMLNTACVDSTTFEEFDSEDCDTEPTPVGWPQMEIDKTPSDAIVNPGQTGLVYTLRIRNNRTVTGSGVQVTDSVAEGLLATYLENLRNVTTTNCGHMAETTIKVKGSDLKAGENPASANLLIDSTVVPVDIPDGADNSGVASAIASAINAEGTHHGIADENVVSVFHGVSGLGSNGKIIDTSALIAAIDLVDITDTDTEMPSPPFSNATVSTDNSTATKIIIDNVTISPYSRSAQECVIEYTVDVKNGIAGGAIIHNQGDATVAIEGGFPVSATADVTVSDSPILSPVKTDDDPDNVVDPLQNVTYTLTIDNIGNQTGTGITVDDTLDTNYENLSIDSITNCGTPDSSSTTANPAVIAITGVEVTTANSCVIVFSAQVKATTPSGTVIPNTAYVSAPLEGGFPTTAPSDNLVIAGSPALTATKVHDKGTKVPPNEVDPGEKVTYTLAIDNIGDALGTGIQVDDTLDGNFQDLNVVSLTNCGPTPNSSGSTANPPVLDVSGVQVATALNCVIVFEVTVKLATPAGTVIPNIAAISPAVEGGPGAPNVPSADIYVPGAVNITTIKTDNDADNYVNPGQIVTYTLSLTNTGDVKLTGIHTLDTMDSDLENLNVTNISNCGSNYFNQSSANPPELDIRGLGGDPNKGLEVNMGVNCVITFTAKVKDTALGFALIPNVATVTESQEGAPATNPASDILEVAMPGVSATKADNDVDSLVNRGQTVTYTIRLNNTNVDSGGNPTTGSRVATGVDIYDVMDNDLTNLNVINLTNCGTTPPYIDGSTADPAVIDIDDLKIETSNDCIIVVTADVKGATLGGSTIPNTVLYSASDEGATGGAASSDVLNVPIACGDGLVEGTEECDDGNLINGDGCEANCTIPPPITCGNGLVEGTEECDDGNLINGDGCEANCTILPPPSPSSDCGDGIKQTNEECDDGNIINGDGCSTSCKIERGCSPCPPPPPPPPPPIKKVCFEYDLLRPLDFIDLDENDDSLDYILALKNSKIKRENDYIFSGNDNHSTGKQQSYFKQGIWDYQPWRNVRRMEAVKAILVSNCIPIEDEIPIPSDGFEFKDVPYDVDKNNDLMHFTARVFYTAYKHGIITKNDEALIHPFQDVNLAETLAIGLRASKSLSSKYNRISDPWYGKYLQYSKDKGILYGINKDPNAKLKRDDFAMIIMRIMWYNSKSKVYNYARDFSFLSQWNANWKKLPDVVSDKDEDYSKENEKKEESLESPIFRDEAFEAEVLRRSAPPESCLFHEFTRKLYFNDVTRKNWAWSFVDLLRTTKLKSSGDFIASGHGNPSTGNEISKYKTGDWEYRPHESVTFFELVKVALLSNCIPIDNTIIPPQDGFQFRQLPKNTNPSDELQYFAARVMYSAYRHGLIKGDVFPFIPVSRFQALAILSRASEIIPRNYEPKPLPFKDTSDNAWYAPYLSYLYEKGMIKGFDDGTFRGNENLKRDEMAKLVTLFMRFNQHPDISKYGIYYMDFYGMNN